MTFSDDIKRHKEKTRKSFRDVFVMVTEEVQRSVVQGSEITGSPGQPVDTGQLRGSWVPSFLTDTAWRTTTNLIYAPFIEEGIGPSGSLTLRSTVGGFHSVLLTRTGFERIVDDAVRKLGTSGQGITVR